MVSSQIQVRVNRTILRLCVDQSSPVQSSEVRSGPIHLPHVPASWTDIGTAPTGITHTQVGTHTPAGAASLLPLTHIQVDSGRCGWLQKPASCTQVNIHTQLYCESGEAVCLSEIVFFQQTLAAMLRLR